MIHVHHRKKRRSKDDRPVNLIGLPDVIHEWVEANPEKAMECGLWVKQNDDPAEIMVTIPEEALKKTRKPRTPVEPKERITTQIKTPKDEQNVIPELLEANRQRHGESMGWEEDVPSYFVIVLALVTLLNTEPGDVQYEKDEE